MSRRKGPRSGGSGSGGRDSTGGFPPFDDPDDEEFWREAERFGIVRKPGMAKELLDQMAPLLAAEGIDLNDPNADYELEDLNAALANATAQYNLQLMTPIGAQLDGALRVLRDSVIALADGKDQAAHGLLDALEPEPSPEQPSTSHVLGTGIGLLDTCLTDRGLEPRLRGTRPIKLWRQAKRTAIDLLALAAKGRAFDSMDSLMLRHGGKLLLDATVLALASLLSTLVAREGIETSAAADELFTARATRSSPPITGDPSTLATRPTNSNDPSPAVHTGAAFGLGTARENTTVPTFPIELLDEFERWLEPDAEDEPSDRTIAELDAFVGLIRLSRREGIDLNVADDIDLMLDVIAEFDMDAPRMEALDVLHDYVHFREQTATFREDRDEWERAHEWVEGASQHEAELQDPVPEELYDAMAAADAVAPAKRWRAFAKLPIVAGVEPFLAWLGKSRGITASGALRRADIEPVAAMIGVSARGVAKHPPFSPGEFGLPGSLNEPLPIPDTYEVQSAHEVPQLAAWWEALHGAQLVDFTATRVRPGVEAGIWPAASLGDRVEAAENLVSVFVSELLTHGVDDGPLAGTFGRMTTVTACSLLLAAVLEENPELDGVSGANGAWALVMPRARQKLAMLERAGLLRTVTGVPVVPIEFRQAVGFGLIGAIEFLTMGGSA